MSKELYLKLVGGLILGILIVGYIVSVYLTKPEPTAPASSGLNFEGNITTSPTANKILQRKAVNNLPLNPPDNQTDNPFLSLE